MNTKFKRTLSVLLALCLTLTTFTCAFAAIPYNQNEITEADFGPDGMYGYITASEIDPGNISNAIVVPGLFQSRTRLYNEDGTVALNEDGEEYEAPFFLEPTGDIVKLALKKALLPLFITLFTRHDFGGKLASSVADALGEILGTKIASDSNGQLIYNVKADKYDDCLANLFEEDREFIYDQIPLIDYADVVDENHLYYYSYCSFGNLEETVDELYELIKKAAAASPTGRTNIVPISQGGSIATNLFERHPEVGQYLDRVVYIVPAADGTILMGELFANGFIDDNKSLYDEIFPVLIDDDDTPWLGYLINVALHLLPNKTVNAILDQGVDGLVKYLKNSTCIWGLVDSKNYPVAANKYLSGSEDKVIRAQTDTHYQAQLDRYENIQYEMDEYGVQFFDIVDYNYRFYPLMDSWKVENADGIINISSTALGATSNGYDTPLPDDYVPAKGDKYVDKYNLVDAGTGYLPDTTFYFHNQDHESTARNDIIIKLAVSLLTDNEFTSVDSYPEKYPQFNEMRDGKGLLNNLRDMNNMLAGDDLGDVDRAELEALVKDGLTFLNDTTKGEEECEQFESEFYARRSRVLYHTEPTAAKETFGDKLGASAGNLFTKFLKVLSTILYKMLPGD